MSRSASLIKHSTNIANMFLTELQDQDHDHAVIQLRGAEFTGNPKYSDLLQHLIPATEAHLRSRPIPRLHKALMSRDFVFDTNLQKFVGVTWERPHVDKYVYCRGGRIRNEIDMAWCQDDDIAIFADGEGERIHMRTLVADQFYQSSQRQYLMSADTKTTMTVGSLLQAAQKIVNEDPHPDLIEKCTNAPYQSPVVVRMTAEISFQFEQPTATEEKKPYFDIWFEFRESGIGKRP